MVDTVKCPYCNGTGGVVMDEGVDVCPECRGSGKAPTAPDVTECVYILYTNYKGETAWRRVVPKQLLFKSTPHHPEEQWILKAHDLDKDAERDFAMKDILKWRVQSD